MKVTLYRDMPEEYWLSMDRYADNLKEFLKKTSPEIEINEFSINQTGYLRPFRPFFRLIPKWGDYLQDKFYSRYILYPKEARKRQGEVNHILDHSYTHVIKSLNPDITVVTCHDLNPLKMDGENASKDLFKKNISNINKARFIIAVSLSTKKDLIELLKVDEQKIAVIYEACAALFKPVQDKNLLNRAAQKFGLGKIPLLLNVGGSDENKNLSSLLKAIKILKEKNKFIFLKVGQDFSEDQQKMIRDLNIEDYVYYLGRVSEQDLVMLYNLALVLISPSLYEGFGFTVLEAMACGLPVICSGSASLPEVGGDAAWYVDPTSPQDLAQKTEKLLNLGTEDYQALKQKCLVNTKRFSWQKTAQETYELYQRVLE